MRCLLRTVALAGVAALTLGGVGAARQNAPKKADDPAPKFDPKDVTVGPPPELAALRAAVEAAARKGENVDEVRAKLDALEKALAGRAWVRPKAAPEPADVPGPAAPPVVVRPGVRPLPPPAADFNLGRLPGRIQPGAAPDLEAVLRGQALLLEAAQLLAEDPAGNRERAEALRRQAQELMLRALNGRNGGGMVLPPGLFDLPGRGGNGRLGVRLDRVPEAAAEQLKLPAGRGVLAAEVVPDTPADKAGVKANDVIIEFAGQPVTDDPAAFVTQVQRARGGVKLDMTVVRGGQQEVIRGVVLAADVAPGRARLFAEAAPIVGADGRPLVEGLKAGPPDRNARKSGVTVEVRDGNATVSGEEDGVRFRITGTVGPDGLVPSRIEVTDNGRTVEAESVDGLPAEYRDRARQLLGRVRVGSGR